MIESKYLNIEQNIILYILKLLFNFLNLSYQLVFSLCYLGMTGFILNNYFLYLF